MTGANAIRPCNQIQYKSNMEKSDIDDLTHSIIGAAVEVHKTLGNGFPIEMYRAALAQEFMLQDILFTQDEELVVYYKNHPLGAVRVDFVVEGVVLVELKTVERIDERHRVQAIQNCKAFNIADGLILNFGGQPLDCKRVYKKP